jgi:putative endonuclease
MGMLARIGFAWVKWKSRYGLRDVAPDAEGDRKQESLRVGVFIAKNYEPAREKGELDLVGFDGETLAFVEVRTRTAAKGKIALPELSIGKEKHEVLVRTAHAFLRERHVKKCPVRFDVVGIDNTPGKPPVVRLHKDALSPRA